MRSNVTTTVTAITAEYNRLSELRTTQASTNPTFGGGVLNISARDVDIMSSLTERDRALLVRERRSDFYSSNNRSTSILLEESETVNPIEVCENLTLDSSLSDFLGTNYFSSSPDNTGRSQVVLRFPQQVIDADEASTSFVHSIANSLRIDNDTEGLGTLGRDIVNTYNNDLSNFHLHSVVRYEDLERLRASAFTASQSILHYTPSQVFNPFREIFYVFGSSSLLFIIANANFNPLMIGSLEGALVFLGASFMYLRPLVLTVLNVRSVASLTVGATLNLFRLAASEMQNYIGLINRPALDRTTVNIRAELQLVRTAFNQDVENFVSARRRFNFFSRSAVLGATISATMASLGFIVRNPETFSSVVSYGSSLIISSLNPQAWLNFFIRIWRNIVVETPIPTPDYTQVVVAQPIDFAAYEEYVLYILEQLQGILY